MQAVSTPRMNAIQLQNLSLSIGAKHLLSDVSFTAEAGERIAIVGANGAGKTTLLRCLLGIIYGDHGEVVIDGENIHHLSRSAIAQKIAYVPQSISSDIPFSVQDFILMSRYSYTGMSHGLLPKDHAGHEVAQTMMKRVGISHLANRNLGTLSGGERQKASLAAALTQQTPILLLDEPTAHLDPKQQESMQEVLGEICKTSNTTMLTVTHDLNWAAMDFHRIIGMRDGKITHDAPPAEFMTTGNLEEIFDVTWDLYPHPQSGLPMVVRSLRGSVNT